MIKLTPCPKHYTEDQDKAVSPTQTVERVKAALAEKCDGVFGELRRIDTGRLGIPVFVSMFGPAARAICPTRKQMGKGASPEQAEASALMELVERYSFFSFWDDEDLFTECTYSEALEKWPGKVMPVATILDALEERGELSEEDAVRVLDLVEWRFFPATNLTLEREEYVPLDLFKKLGEFNGSSAGNTLPESILQGASELVERHVSAVVDRGEPELPTIQVRDTDDPVLVRLMKAFTDNGLKVLLKDFTLGQPLPTVAALAYDPATFPGLSEIVYTAGTASSPAKAAIRALTEVAQLGGDFETGAVYEASGLGKFAEIEEFAWLEKGPACTLDDLPTLERDDIAEELRAFTRELAAQGKHLYSVETTNPALEGAAVANYNFIPGYLFRERDPGARLGMFTGRVLAEDAAPDWAAEGLEILAEVYPEAHFVPFFRGMVAMREGELDDAHDQFAASEPLQPDADNKGLAAFYAGYSLTLAERWEDALPALGRAVEHCPEMKEYHNLRGVAHYRLQDYEAAARDFGAALDIDRGSAVDLANLGVCHKFLGKTASARDYLETALKLDPSLEFARTHLEEMAEG